MFALPAAALLLCLAGQVDLDGVVVAETRAGQAPVVAGQPSQFGVIGVLTPGAQLRYASRITELRLDSGVRIFWREPNYLGLSRPLFLSITTLAASSRLTHQFKGTATSSISVGEPDYTELARILGPSQALLPQGIAEVLSITAGLRGDYQASRTLSLGLGTEFIHRRPLGNTAAEEVLDRRTSDTPPQEVPTAVADVFPRQTSITIVPSALAQVSPRDGIIFTSVASYGTYSTGSTILTITPLFGWAGHVTRDLDLRLLGGITYVNVLKVPPVPVAAGSNTLTQPSSEVRPAADAQMSVRVITQGQVLVRSNTQVRADYFVDPVLGVATPRGLILTGLTATFAPAWMVGVNGSFTTSLSAHALPGTPRPDETIVAVSLPAQHRLSENLVMEMGARWADAGPHLSTGGLGFHQRQVWIYLMLTATSRRVPAWTVP